MLELGGDESDEAAAGRRLKGYKADDSFETPDTSNHSEWAELAVLSAGWRDKAPRIVVAHPADTMRVEIHSDKHVLFSGEWPVEATINGAPVESTDEWDCQCWHSDEEGDYLELALDLEDDARLERQFFVSRADGRRLRRRVAVHRAGRAPPDRDHFAAPDGRRRLPAA